MRDLVIERNATYQYLESRGRQRLRCRVCRGQPRAQWSTVATSPQGRDVGVPTCSSYYCRARAKAFAFEPTDQTTFGPKLGNCFSACVAMILELPISEVPFFMVPGEWWDRFSDWSNARGFRPLFYQDPATPPPGYSIAGGTHVRGHFLKGLHACLAFDGRIVFDPNPLRNELVEVRDYITLERT